MRRFLPRSLTGQVMLVLALGLLVGQAISGVLLLRAAEQRRDTAVVNQLALRIVTADERGAMRQALREARWAERGQSPRPALIRRGQRIETAARSPLLPGERRAPRYEAALREVLAEQGIEPRQIVITTRLAGEDPVVLARPRLQQRIDPAGWRDRRIAVAGIERSDGSGWMVVRQPLPPRAQRVIGTIIFQTLVIFAVLFALLAFVLRRMTRPLAELTARLGDDGHRPGEAPLLEERGPQDMRALIAAYNAMETRIAALLGEKDVMLGAIGHDLKTPLAALRVRIESVPDESQRQRMAQVIEDITHTLDDILELARVGKSGEATERTDLAALVGAVVGEYEDMGKPVELGEAPRIALSMRPILMRRALRNLIDNALRYGERAAVTITTGDGQAAISICDEGPGIPAGQIAAMLEPFARGEASRNRATGGAGLGLTLARAIVLQHGGKLVLANRPEGGLRAEIRLPL
ncbi:MAG: ATP-binding protein [Erythrobacter sp.]